MEQIARIHLIIRQVPKENIVSCEVETQSCWVWFFFFGESWEEEETAWKTENHRHPPWLVSTQNSSAAAHFDAVCCYLRKAWGWSLFVKKKKGQNSGWPLVSAASSLQQESVLENQTGEFSEATGVYRCVITRRVMSGYGVYKNSTWSMRPSAGALADAGGVIANSWLSVFESWRRDPVVFLSLCADKPPLTVMYECIYMVCKYVFTRHK